MSSPQVSPLDQILKACDETIELHSNYKNQDLRQHGDPTKPPPFVEYGTHAMNTADSTARALKILAEEVNSIAAFHINKADMKLLEPFSRADTLIAREALVKAAKILEDR